MQQFNPAILKDVYRPSKASHKGQNGKLTIVGGSKLFHGASLWALKVSSRIVDMVFYASTSENNALTEDLKGQLYDFIAISRDKAPQYIEESDAILIGSGLPRESGQEKGEESTKELTQSLLSQFPKKKWILDAGSLQTIDPDMFKKFEGNILITPHHKEFQTLFGAQPTDEAVKWAADQYGVTILLKGTTDIVCSPSQSVLVSGGNEGMTKGGTGDVLAGLVAALATKNDLFTAAQVGSYINKKAGDSLYERVGPYFNASDLCDEIPKVMKEIFS